MTQLAAKRHPTDPNTPIEVVGIGADGFPSLTDAARQALINADVIVGSWRQLNLLPEQCRAERRPWPSPLVPSIEPLFEELAGRRVAVLASGDPMFHGIGTTLVRILGAQRLHIHSAPSSVALACARLGWAVDRTPVVSLVTKPVASVVPFVDGGQPFMVLCRDETSVGEVADGPVTAALLAELRLPRASTGYAVGAVDGYLANLADGAVAAEDPQFLVVRGGYDMQAVDELLQRPRYERPFAADEN